MWDRSSRFPKANPEISKSNQSEIYQLDTESIGSIGSNKKGLKIVDNWRVPHPPNLPKRSISAGNDSTIQETSNNPRFKSRISSAESCGRSNLTKDQINNPGPGAYELQTESHISSIYFTPSGVERRKRPSIPMPGPGYYDPNDSLIKPSFNQKAHQKHELTPPTIITIHPIVQKLEQLSSIPKRSNIHERQQVSKNMKSLLSKLSEPLVYDIIKEDNVVSERKKDIRMKGNYFPEDHGFSPISEEIESTHQENTSQENIPHAFPLNT